MNTEEMAYVGIAKCGCIKGASVDVPEHAKDTAKFVSDFIRRGYKVERWPCSQVRESKWKCEECKKARRSDV